MCVAAKRDELAYWLSCEVLENPGYLVSTGSTAYYTFKSGCDELQRANLFLCGPGRGSWTLRKVLRPLRVPHIISLCGMALKGDPKSEKNEPGSSEGGSPDFRLEFASVRGVDKSAPLCRTGRKKRLPLSRWEAGVRYGFALDYGLFTVGGQ